MVSSLICFKILLVEDNLPDVIILKKQFQKLQTLSVKLTHVSTCRDAIFSLQSHDFDVILLDLSLPDSHNLDTVKTIYSHSGDIPILILTGLDDQVTAIASVREGAQDYLVKGQINLDNLQRSIRYAIERKQRLKEINILNKKLSTSNQELENYAYIVSHDLKQPLQTILASSQLILHLEKNLKEQSYQLLEFILASTNQMNKLIDNLLSYAQINKKSIEKEIVCVENIIKNVMKFLNKQIQDSKASINIQMNNNNKPIKVFYNSIQLSQILQNLMSNAIKYIPYDRTPEIQITIEKKEETWLFMVKDNGIGVKPEDQGRIFEMLERVDTDRKYSGSGIGLAICQKIVEINGGKIWVESILNKGSTFFFTIPILAIEN
ncbi:ATP-binding protein [Geminocystis sp. NIES-3709]|uniref:ATP-binding protein n=1 Tax=Geminocystis sp. NIES-3709 TaxID=1617448 RepID=UPI0005FCBC05|nr:ATP-binding protein [Geminocystis sp. NIES-3709]BAQ65795.1 phytochrome [Geminocystis sp. NIES-3709]